MQNLEEKYIELILKRCLNFEKAKALLIHIEFKEHLDFARKVKAYANKMGINDVYIHLENLERIHSYLQDMSIDDIESCMLIRRDCWDTYSKKGAALLLVDSPAPGLMDDIPQEKINKWIVERTKTAPYYNNNVSLNKFPWTIVALPNERWAKSVFGDNREAYKKLEECIYQMCMIDKENPIASWNDFIAKSNYYKNRLNELKIKTLHYTNSLGTDLTVGLPKDIIWHNIGSDGPNLMTNLPSYEIYTTPDYRQTEGKVYVSKPTIDEGRFMDKISLEFHNGKVTSYQAKVGQEALTDVLKQKNCAFLGEVALVAKSSPIAQSNIIFNSTLFDENSSSHIALGGGFPNCFRDYQNQDIQTLIRKGLNIAADHVDLMIGTDDLQVEAETTEGYKLILKNGEFNL